MEQTVGDRVGGCRSVRRCRLPDKRWWWLGQGTMLGWDQVLDSVRS